MIAQVDRFPFLVNFMIMDIKKDKEVPKILGRPFM